MIKILWYNTTNHLPPRNGSTYDSHYVVTNRLFGGEPTIK